MRPVAGLSACESPQKIPRKEECGSRPNYECAYDGIEELQESGKAALTVNLIWRAIWNGRFESRLVQWSTLKLASAIYSSTISFE
jgi:hypothetical protein